jgi:Peptidase A4 family
VKVIGFPAPPPDFDPLTAPNEKLRRYGYPRRPDAAAEPALRSLWDRALSQRPTIVRPSLVETAWGSRPYAPRAKARSEISRGRNQDQLGPDGPLGGEWGGGIVDLGLPLSPDEAFTYVYGEWRVPAIDTTMPAEPGTQYVAFWIGLGGWNTGHLWQAGVVAKMTGNSVSYFAVTDLIPSNWVAISNFPVAAGDVITMLVCAPQVADGFDINAFAMMLNQRTQIAMAVGTSGPKDPQVDGSTVEWIVEATNTEMPNFGTMSFTNCVAGNQRSAINLTDMNAFTIAAQSPITGDLLATANIDAPQDKVAVSWVAAT